MPGYSFDDMITGQASAVSTTARELRRMLLKAEPRLEEQISGGAKIKVALYGIGGPNNIIAGIQPAADHCKLYLHFTDKINLETPPLEGKGKHAKHVKVTQLTPEWEQKLAEMVRAVIIASGY